MESLIVLLIELLKFAFDLLVILSVSGVCCFLTWIVLLVIGSILEAQEKIEDSPVDWANKKIYKLPNLFLFAIIRCIMAIIILIVLFVFANFYF